MNNRDNIPSSLKEAASKVTDVILDIDGVLTDGKIYINEEGVESLAFNIKDGYGLATARDKGLTFWVITGRDSKAVDTRLRNLKITHVYKGVLNKKACFDKLVQQGLLKPETTAYIGDDVIDLPLLRSVAFPATVADAHPEVRAFSPWVSRYNGGSGAVRELIDLLLFFQTTEE